MIDIPKQKKLEKIIIQIMEEITGETIQTIVPNIPFREQLNIDSMDFLDLIMELRKRYKVEVPEKDYPNLNTMESSVIYLEPLMPQDFYN